MCRPTSSPRAYLPPLADSQRSDAKGDIIVIGKGIKKNDGSARRLFSAIMAVLSALETADP